MCQPENMNNLNVQKTSLAFGLLLSGFHFCWAVLVFLGIAQAIVDFVLWAHMIHMQYTAGPFEFSAALTLLVFTFVTGYIMGFVFASVWNWLHAK